MERRRHSRRAQSAHDTLAGQGPFPATFAVAVQERPCPQRLQPTRMQPACALVSQLTFARFTERGLDMIIAARYSLQGPQAGALEAIHLALVLAVQGSSLVVRTDPRCGRCPQYQKYLLLA